MNPTNYLVLSAILFSIGAGGVLVRRNAIVVFMCIELMLNASNLAFVTFARTLGQLDGQPMLQLWSVSAAVSWPGPLTTRRSVNLTTLRLRPVE